jgi:hypothetical protein
MRFSSIVAIALLATPLVVGCSSQSSLPTPTLDSVTGTSRISAAAPSLDVAAPAPVPQPASTEAANRSEGAQALWEYTDAGGCVVTRITISLGHDISAAVAAVGTYVERYDTCTPDGWTWLISGNNAEGQSLTASEFQIDRNLASARLRTTVTNFLDAVSGSFKNVELDLTWTATGELQIGQNQHFHDNQRDPRLLINEHQLQVVRLAVAQGAVIIGSVDYTASRASLPDLIMRSTDITVTKP